VKSTIEEIRQRFDNDVERFSNLETGQAATIDSPLALELIAQAAAAVTPHATHLLDVGCGAGNYTLKLLQYLPNLNVTLVDLSRPMLDRAVERIRPVTNGEIIPLQSDIRVLLTHAAELSQGAESSPASSQPDQHSTLSAQNFDIILAASVLHHLRDDSEWHDVFSGFYRSLRPGGSLWIFDLVESAIPAVQSLLWRRYGDYLTDLKDETYRKTVYAYVEKEDTPRPLTYQLDLLREVGFSAVEILHKNTCFAAFGAVKS
jgi:tRNA (cmo5U34)-methyltransferase